jgi:hypothetical protein
VKCKVLLAFAFLASPIAAHAQATPDPAALSAARDLMVATDVKGQMRAIGPAISKAMDQQIQQMFVDNKVPDGLSQQFSAAMQDYFGSMDTLFTPELTEEIASIYARHFSPADLTRLTEMMKDPVMNKFRIEMPAIMGEMMPSMSKAMKPRQDAFMTKVKQIVADWIKQHPNDKAKLRSPSAI